MPVNINVRDTKFFNEFKNDVGFTANTSDFTLNLTGSVMENIKMTTLVDINWSASVTSSDSWSADTINGSISRSNGNWVNDGFSIGDVCGWLQNGVLTANITIDSISQNGSTIFYTLNSGSLTDSNNGSLAGLTYLSASIYKFGLLENSESFNVESKVSGNDQGYYGGNIGGAVVYPAVRNTTFVNMIRLGQNKDWQTGSIRIRFVSNPSYDIQRFEIEHIFTIVPYYVDGELSNLQNNILPNLFDGLNTLKYSFSPGLRTVLTNPNTEKKTTINNNLGSVGYFGETFNGLQNDYEVLSIDYKEAITLNNADGILVGSNTTVTIQVQNNAGNFTAGERAGVYVSYLPKQNEYDNTILTDLKENFLYDNAVNSGGAGVVAGQDFITNFEITNIVTNTMTLTFDVKYSTAQKLRLAGLNAQNPIYFVIGVQLGDITLPSGNSNRLLILADVNVYDVSADIPGLMSFTKFDIYTQERQIGVDAGNTDVVAWVEDGVAVDYTLALDLNKDALLNSLDFILVAYDPITQIYFQLDKYTFNIFPAIVSSGIQQLITNTTRGYTLAIGDQFNDVILNVGANVAGIQDYDGIIVQKFSWQDWIVNLNVDTVFFDGTKPNNNLNNKSSNYSFLNGYEIRLGFFGNIFGTNTLGVSGLTDYLVLSPSLITYDYEEDGGANIWSHVIETFDATGSTNLGGAILTGQDTLFRSTWTNSGGAVTSLVNIWGINRIEETGQPGYAIEEMSSINLPPPNQLLKPNSGTKLFVYLNAGKVVMECLIDGGIAQSGINYNLSTRIQDDNAIPSGAKITEQSVLKDTEAGVQKIIE